MKNKLMKIWGVVLVVVVLAGLLVSAMPASAANLAWTAVPTPAVVPTINTLVNPVALPTDIIMAGAPDGKSLFVYDNTNDILYRSTDAGATWLSSVAAVNGIPAGTYVSISVSPDFANDKAVAIASAGAVYASNNAGVSFGASLTAFAGLTNSIAGAYVTPAITSVAIGPYYFPTGTAIMIGIKDPGGIGGAAVLVPGGFGGTWTSLNFAASFAAGVNVLAVAFSPNHRADAGLLFVTADAAGVYFESKYGTSAVDANVGIVPIDITMNATNITTATMAFAADYAASNVAFVGFNAAAATSDVYRINITNKVGATVTAIASDLNANGVGTTAITSPKVNSLSFKGNLADGWLYVGMTTGVLKRATATGGTVVAFLLPQKGSNGLLPTIFASPAANDANIFVMTANAGSAFFVSADGAQTFNEQSLIYVTTPAVTINDLSVIDANTMYYIMVDGTNSTLFKTTNGGTIWQGVLVEIAGVANLEKIYPSPTYATDNTVYVTQGDSTIWKTTNAGSNFITLVAPGAAITSFALVDANTYFVGTTTGLFKSGSYVAAIGTATSNISSIAYIDATTMYIGTSVGGLLTSSNGGATFTAFLPPTGLAVPIIVKADVNYATNKILYVASATVLEKFTVGTSLAWTPFTYVGAVGISKVTQGTDGTLYITDNALANNSVQRNVNPTVPGPATWDSMFSATNGMPANTGSTGVSALATGTAQVPNNTLYGVLTIAGSPNRIYTYQDTLVAPPTVSSPAANGQVANNVTFTWAAPAGAGMITGYTTQLAYDATFINVINIATPIAGTIAPVVTVAGAGGLNAGQEYYFRVKAVAPLSSKWSASTKFSVKLAQAGGSLVGEGGTQIFPAAGANNVPSKPVFQWAAVNGAVSYDLQVADNPVFVNPLDNQTGLNTTVWTETKTLDYGKTYYWRVRAVSASGVASDWVAQAFTVMPAPATGPAATGPAATAPVVVPTVTVNIPAQPQPTFTVNVPAQTTGAPQTPASIWVLIAIGAILIIAVIVLIARTRRV